jgi:hypothetical protein
MIRLSKGERLAGETAISYVRGGPWDARVAMLSTAPLEKYRGLELHTGLSAPFGSRFTIMPELAEGQRDVIFITGASGSGKSTAAADYAKNFIETFREGGSLPNVVLVCPDSDDRAFDGIKMIHVTPADLAAEMPTLDDFVARPGQPTLMIFDDIEGLHDKKQQAALDSLVQAVLERGRKKMIYVLFLSHSAANGKSTKIILKEMRGVWFPLTGNEGNLSYMLKKYLSIPPELKSQLKKHMSEFGPWIYIKTDTPTRYFITEKKVSVLDEDEIVRVAKMQKKLEDRADIAVAEHPVRAIRIPAKSARRNTLAALRDAQETSEGEEN